MSYKLNALRKKLLTNKTFFCPNVCHTTRCPIQTKRLTGKMSFRKTPYLQNVGETSYRQQTKRLTGNMSCGKNVLRTKRIADKTSYLQVGPQQVHDQSVVFPTLPKIINFWQGHIVAYTIIPIHYNLIFMHYIKQQFCKDFFLIIVQ